MYIHNNDNYIISRNDAIWDSLQKPEVWFRIPHITERSYNMHGENHYFTSEYAKKSLLIEIFASESESESESENWILLYSVYYGLLKFESIVVDDDDDDDGRGVDRKRSYVVYNHHLKTRYDHT
jgi:hypothetical protein